MDTTTLLETSNNQKIKIQSSLMKNYLPESILDASEQIQAINLSDELELVLFIDKNKTLKILNASVKNDLKWKVLNLSKQDDVVTAYSVYYSEATQSLTLSYAFSRGQQNHLHFSNQLSVQTLTLANWKNELKWNSVKLSNQKRIINHISLTENAMLFSTCESIKTKNPQEIQNDAQHHFYRLGGIVSDYTLPENAEQIKQLALGVQNGVEGVFLLCSVNKSKSLLFKSLEVNQFDEYTFYRYSTAHNINAFDLITDEQGDSVLFTSGDGIYKFRNADDAPEMIVSNNQGLSFDRIVVANDANKETIWVITESGAKGSGLYYITNEYALESNGTSCWTPPLKMQEYTIDFSAYKGHFLSNQLYLIGKINPSDDLGFVRLYQDKFSKQWTETYVTAHDLTSVTEVQTYTIDVQLEMDLNDAEEILHKSGDLNLSFRTSETVAIYINDQRVWLTPNSSINLPVTDGRVNIVYPVSGIDMPPVFFAGSLLNSEYELQPSNATLSKLKKNLGEMDKLKSAKLNNGESLVPAQTTSDDLNLILGAIHSLPETERETPELNNQLSSIYPQQELEGFSIGNIFADVWHAVKKGYNTISEITVNVVNGVKTFVINIAGAVWNFVVETANQIASVVVTVFKYIKVAVEKVFEFLAFIFNWEDVKRTKNAIKAFSINCLISLEKNVNSLEQFCLQYLNTVKKQLTEQLNTLEVIDVAAHATQTKENHSENEGSSWLLSKSGYLSKVKDEVTDNLLNTQQKDFIAGPVTLFSTHLNTIYTNNKQLFDDMIKLCKAVYDKEISINTFFEKLIKLLLVLTVDFASKFVELLFKVVRGGIKLLNDILVEKINVPFFSGLYQMISGDELSIIDLICLLIAVPATIVYKISATAAPFENESEVTSFAQKGLTFFELQAS